MGKPEAGQQRQEAIDRIASGQRETWSQILEAPRVLRQQNDDPEVKQKFMVWMAMQLLVFSGLYLAVGRWIPDGAIMLVIAYAFGGSVFAGTAAIEGEFTFEERIACIAITHAVFFLIAALGFVLFLRGMSAPEMHFRVGALKFTFIFVGLPIYIVLWATSKGVVAVLRKGGCIP